MLYYQIFWRTLPCSTRSTRWRSRRRRETRRRTTRIKWEIKFSQFPIVVYWFFYVCLLSLSNWTRIRFLRNFYSSLCYVICSFIILFSYVCLFYWNELLRFLWVNKTKISKWTALRVAFLLPPLFHIKSTPWFIQWDMNTSRTVLV